jgi:hypothetical protein
LSAAHGDTLAAAVVAGDVLIGNATPKWARLAKGSQYAVLGMGAALPAWSSYLLDGTAGGKTVLAVTNAKTLTLTAADTYNLTIPATGTAALGSGTQYYIPYWTGANTLGDSSLHYDGAVHLHDIANAANLTGITIQQGAADDEALSLKSTDVAHGITDITETDTYASFLKYLDSGGGLRIFTFSEGDVGFNAWSVATVDNTTKTTAAVGNILLDTFKKSGTTVGAHGANANLVVIRQGNSARFIFDAEGSAHADVEWVAFDEYNDVALLRRLEQTVMARQFGGWVDENRAELEQLEIAHFDNTPGHAMVNWTRLSMLLVGAIRQLSQRCKLLEANNGI